MSKDPSEPQDFMSKFEVASQVKIVYHSFHVCLNRIAVRIAGKAIVLVNLEIGLIAAKCLLTSEASLGGEPK
jgi:hypothetical protein